VHEAVRHARDVRQYNEKKQDEKKARLKTRKENEKETNK
jgi:hypothetical protein